jgi:hypothetical protein
MAGDGHTAMKKDSMKQSEDASFDYRLTWIETNHGKGWVTHYRAKHPPLSSELESVFAFLKLQQFTECPEFDFEPCHWRSMAFEQRGDSYFDSNVEFAHRCFDAHATNFSQGVEKLLTANTEIEEAGLTLLPFAAPTVRLTADIKRRTIQPSRAAPSPLSPSTFDVAISFAGTERELAEKLADRLRAAGIAVFYDNFYPEQLWGKNLTAFLDQIYRKSAKFCVVFVSKDYKERQWTNHELRSAQAKALELKGQEYILPVKIDDTELEGLPPNVGYVSISLGIDKIADMLIKKLKS